MAAPYVGRLLLRQPAAVQPPRRTHRGLTPACCCPPDAPAPPLARTPHVPSAALGAAHALQGRRQRRLARRLRPRRGVWRLEPTCHIEVLKQLRKGVTGRGSSAGTLHHQQWRMHAAHQGADGHGAKAGLPGKRETLLGDRIALAALHSHSRRRLCCWCARRALPCSTRSAACPSKSAGSRGGSAASSKPKQVWRADVARNARFAAAVTAAAAAAALPAGAGCSQATTQHLDCFGRRGA